MTAFSGWSMATLLKDGKLMFDLQGTENTVGSKVAYFRGGRYDWLNTQRGVQ